MEDRYSLNTDDSYVKLKDTIDLDFTNNNEYLTECDNFSSKTSKFGIDWLDRFSCFLGILLPSWEKSHEKESRTFDLYLLFVDSLGMSPLKEIYAFHLIMRYLSNKSISSQKN